MKTLEEIKEEYAKEVGCGNWVKKIYHIGTPAEFDYIVNEVANRYALEVAKEALKNASENASENAKFVVDGDEEDYYTSFSSCGGYSSSITISKQSILSETNIPELK